MKALITLLVVTLGILLLACGAFPAKTPPVAGSASAGLGKIAFVSNRDRDWEIYVMNADGTAQTRLTHLPSMDTGPVWSPDGTRTAFSSNSSGGDVYVTNADGSNLTRLTSDPANDGDPSWSPDGKRIAFSSNRDGQYEVYVMNADGSAQTRLTAGLANNGGPKWSPDGSHIAYWSSVDGTESVYLMNADGSGQRKVASGVPFAFASDVAWSPDGSQLAFALLVGQQSNEDGEVFVVDADGSNLRSLTANSVTNDTEPAWSPDGRRIVFVSRSHSGKAIISVMNADGSGLVQLADSLQAKVYFHPRWSPDGKQVALEAQAKGQANGVAIYVMNADGSGLMRLTDQPTDDFDPVWSPGG
jgi:Tol biopolymer transport system component